MELVHFRAQWQPLVQAVSFNLSGSTTEAKTHCITKATQTLSMLSNMLCRNVIFVTNQINKLYASKISTPLQLFYPLEMSSVRRKVLGTPQSVTTRQVALRARRCYSAKMEHWGNINAPHSSVIIDWYGSSFEAAEPTAIISPFFSSWRDSPPSGPWPPHSRGFLWFLDHAQLHITVGGTPLDE